MILRFALVSLLAAACGAAAENAVKSAAAPAMEGWPHWAGPNGDCTSNEKGLLKEWPQEGPKVLWRIPIATGSNHPSVLGDDLCFAQLEDNQKTETFKCVDSNTGKEKWSYSHDVPPIWHVGWGELGPRATPTITEEYVYAIGTFGDAFCFDKKTGAIVWQQKFNLQSPYLDGKLKGAGNLEWKGFNSSLMPIGDKIPYFYWQGGNPPIAAWAKTEVTRKMQFFAFDAKTGEVAWKYEEDCPPGSRGPGLCPAGYLQLKFNNEDCVVIHGNRQWKILRLADGKQLWSWECTGPVDSPGWASAGLRKVGDNLYLDALNGWVPSLIECDFTQANPKPKVLWTALGSHEAFTPPVIWDGCIYGFYIDSREDASAVSSRPGEMNYSFRCTDLKTGKLLWKEPGFHMGLAITAGDGMLYIHDYQRVTLVQASTTGYIQKGRLEHLHAVKNIGRNTHKGLLDWSMPVISNGRLFIRTPVEIICYDIKDPSAK